MGAMLGLLPPHENQWIAAFTSENVIIFEKQNDFNVPRLYSKLLKAK